MQGTNKKKICIVVSSLGIGGAEKVGALQSIMLSNLGYCVHIVSVLNNIDYKYSGTLLNLGLLKDKDDSVLGRFKRFLIFKKYIQNNNFDFIIDHRTRISFLREIIITQFIYRKNKTIYVAHNYNLKKVFFKAKKWVKFNYKSAYKIIGVSKSATENVRKTYLFNNVETIYNSFNIEEIKKQSQSEVDIHFNYILYFGRLDDAHKNIQLLIAAYKKSKLPKQNIKLIILGDGDDKEMLQKIVIKKCLAENVIFLPFEKNPYKYIRKAKYVVLTSHYEGFPMVIPESLICETPVISVNCESGPKEIIKHKENGLLVENYNVLALAEAMNSFVFDEALYKKCKQNTQKSIAHLSVLNIAKQWQKVIENEFN